MGTLDIPIRSQKPRADGITLVNDRGIGIRAWQDAIDMAGEYVDIVKLGIGTAYVMQNLHQKVSFLQQHDIRVILGGTLFENFWVQDQLPSYYQFVKDLGLDCVEISSGSYPIPLADKIAAVSQFANEFCVLAEVGDKDDHRQASNAGQVAEALALRQAGATKVIMEGRASGTGGMYNDAGEPDDTLITAMTDALPIQDIIFEAPLESQQIDFIRRFGANVNLGNVPFEDILMLETERVGLRFDTQSVTRALEPLNDA